MTNDRRYDLVIRNGTLIDGTGAPARPADLGIAGGRIAALGDLGDAHGAVELDAAGRIVAPGFIDVHTHDDNALLVKPDMTYKTSQGVTTVVAGNCGLSLEPFTLAMERAPAPLDLLGDNFRFPRMADLFHALDAAPPAVKCAQRCGRSEEHTSEPQSLMRKQS